LEDSRRNKNQYVGFPNLGVYIQPLDNQHLRQTMKLTKTDTGVVVNAVQRVSPAASKLRRNDVLTHFDGHPIANDGTVHFRGRERIDLQYLLSKQYAGDDVLIRVIRDGKPMEVTVNVFPIPQLVPVFQYDKIPSYTIYAGLVFVPLTQPYLREYGYEWYNNSPRHLCELAMEALPDFADEQIVILSSVLPHEINTGYQRYIDIQVCKVNGIPVRNLKHLTLLIDSIVSGKELADPYGTDQKIQSRKLAKPGLVDEHTGDVATPIASNSITLELTGGRLIIIDCNAAAKAEQEILSVHRIPAARSVDLRTDSETASDVGLSLHQE
jgi:PDZ domain